MMNWNPGFYNDGSDFRPWDEPEDAHDAAHDEICGYRDDSYWGEWSDQVDKVGYGICLPLAVATEESVNDEDAPEDAVDYHLREPEIDAAAFWATVSKHAPKVAEALAGALHDRLLDKLNSLTSSLAAVDYFKAQDPMVKLESWRNEDPAHHRYLIRRGAVFYVELEGRACIEDDRILRLAGYSQGDTLAEAVNDALEAAKRGAT